MYVDFPSVMLMLMGALIGVVIGLATRSMMGLVIGVVGGLAAACISVTTSQSREIEAWRYQQLERIRGEDCRVAPMIKTAVGDRIITRLEYYRIMDAVERNAVVDARDSLAQVSQRQCVTG